MAISKTEQMADWLKSYGYKELRPLEFYAMLFGDCLSDKNEEGNKCHGVGMVQTIIKPRGADKGWVKTFDKNLDGLKKAIDAANEKYEDLEKRGRLGEVSILTITNGCSYLGKRMVASNIFELSALIVEVDDLIGNDTTNQEGLKRLILSMKQGEDGRLNRLGEPLLPNPTVIVCSGSVVHLYYIFQKPIRVNRKSFPKQYKSLNNYKYCLMYTLWKKLGITERELEIQGMTKGTGLLAQGQRAVVSAGHFLWARRLRLNT